MYIYTKRIDHVNLCIVMHNFGRCRVLLYKGKRADFTEFKKAKAKVWQLEQTLGKGAEWTAWMAKSELEARINARLDRALFKSLELGPNEIRDVDGEVWDIDDAVEADWEAQFNRAFGDTNTNEPQPYYQE